jgi:hypothetical protein
MGVDRKLERRNSQTTISPIQLSSKPSASLAKTMQDKTRSEDTVSPRTSQHTTSLQSDSEYRYSHVYCIEWLPTRPGHVTLSISFVALIVAVMSTQYHCPAPCLGQPINGATHPAENREMGLKVSHDQYCGIVNRFSFAYCGRPCGRSQAVQLGSPHTTWNEHNIVAEPPLAIL